ncbi:MAG: hypothetical protein K0S20_576 [Patescibacteria group bacterium]|jgi:hypothetical protein|nr:hypothetical protein [Patescibacteria group bacterium]
MGITLFKRILCLPKKKELTTISMTEAILAVIDAQRADPALREKTILKDAKIHEQVQQALRELDRGKAVAREQMRNQRYAGQTS